MARTALESTSSTLAGRRRGPARPAEPSPASPRSGSCAGAACRCPRRASCSCCRPGCRPATSLKASAVLIYAIVGLSLVVLTGLGRPGLARPDGVRRPSVRPSAAWPPRTGASTSRLALLVAGVAGAVAAVVVGLPALRLRGLYLGRDHLRVRAGDVRRTSSTASSSTGSRPARIERPPLLRAASTCDSPTRIYYVFLAVLVLAIFALRGIGAAAPGGCCIALRENEAGAQAYGVDRRAGQAHRVRHLRLPGRLRRLPLRPPPAGLRPGPYAPGRELRRLHHGRDRRPRLDARRAARRRSTSRLTYWFLASRRLAAPAPSGARRAARPAGPARRARRPRLPAAGRVAAVGRPTRRGLVVPSFVDGRVMAPRSPRSSPTPSRRMP